MNRMKQLREKMGISMTEAAKRLSMPYTTYVNYEKGVREPDSETLIQIANFYETTIDYLLFRYDTNPEHLMNLEGSPEGSKDPDKNVSKSEEGNLIRIAARNGTYIRRRLTDQQLAALIAVMDQMPDATDDL